MAISNDYFEELIPEYKAIRASEARFFDKTKHLISISSMDYSGIGIREKQLFFSRLQNKMLYAVAEKTAAGILLSRANSALPFMGLTSFKNKNIRKTDVIVAKNYLAQEELFELDSLVSMFLDYAEDRTEKMKVITLKDWIHCTDNFLSFNERIVLRDSGRIASHKAKSYAVSEYIKYREVA